MAASCDAVSDSDDRSYTCESESDLVSLALQFEEEISQLISESNVDTPSFTPVTLEECIRIIEDEKIILTTIYESIEYLSEDNRTFEADICFGNSKIGKEDEISITFQLPSDYPNSIPIFELNNSKSQILTFSETDLLYDALLQSALEQRGTPMIYNLIQQVHDYCEETILAKKKSLDCSLHDQLFADYKSKSSTSTTPGTQDTDTIESDITYPSKSPPIQPSQFISLRNIIDECKTSGYRVNGVENVLRPNLAERFIATQKNIANMERKYKNVKNFSCTPEIVYHGTAEQNLPSIVSKGLLMPGTEKVRVVHGSAYGVGIYVGTSPVVSLSYSNTCKLLVCALIPGMKVPFASGRKYEIYDGGSFYVIKNPSQLLPCWVISLSFDSGEGTDLGLLSASTKSATNNRLNVDSDEVLTKEEKQELLEARMRKFLPFGFGPGDRTVILDAGDWDDDDDAILEGRNAEDNIIIDYGIVKEEKSKLQDFRFLENWELTPAESSTF